MPLSENAAVSQDIAAFNGQGGAAAKLNYDVPLPSVHDGRRLVALDLHMQAADWRQQGVPAAQGAVAAGGGGAVAAPAAAAGAPAVAGNPVISLADAIGIAAGAGGAFFDTQRASEFFQDAIAASGAATLPRDQVRAALRTARSSGLSVGLPASRRPDLVGLTPDPEGGGNVPPLPDYIEDLLAAARAGQLLKLSKKWGGGILVQPVPINPAPKPAIFLVEVYGISSFLGDYGLGRTIRTMSLLPGEETTISVKTWRSREQTRAEGSTIVDSFQTSSADRFAASFERENTDQKSKSNKHTWSAGVEAKGGVNLGIVSFGGGGSASGSGEYHSSREQLARTMSSVMREHTNESNAAREMNVTSSSEIVDTEGEETVTERTIRNVNMRRTLNFVFRELNQTYITKFHLRDLRVAFTDGRPGTWREEPLSGLRSLLEDVVVPNRVDGVAQAFLRQASLVFDATGAPVQVLDSIRLQADGGGWAITSPAPRNRPDAQGNANREFEPPSNDLVYRFKPGPLAQQQGNQVDGVVLSEQKIVLRTDSVVVEALLGEADALDPYAMLTQKADAEARIVRNDRERLAQDVIKGVAAGQNQADAFASIFNADDSIRLSLRTDNAGP